MAIKIIKPGKKPETFQFECPHCGCVFESLDGYSCNTADCPTCGRKVYKSCNE